MTKLTRTAMVQAFMGPYVYSCPAYGQEEAMDMLENLDQRGVAGLAVFMESVRRGPIGNVAYSAMMARMMDGAEVDDADPA